MKLFNINLNINSMKNILKLLLLAFIVILCIYILYISSFSTIEAFTESKDCSNCQIMPSSGSPDTSSLTIPVIPYCSTLSKLSPRDLYNK